jgi:hypothetical protein
VGGSVCAFEDFVPIVLDLKPDGPGYLNLPKKFHDKYTLGKRPATKQPPLPKEEHRDLSWFVDATSGHPPAADIGKVTKPKAPPQEGVADRPKRSTRNTAPAYRLSGYDDEIASPWSRPSEPHQNSLPRLVTLWWSSRPRCQDSSTFSAGNCKGQTTVADWHATLARRKATRM